MADLSTARFAARALGDTTQREFALPSDNVDPPHRASNMGLRRDSDIAAEIVAFIQAEPALSVVISDGIGGLRRMV